MKRRYPCLAILALAWLAGCASDWHQNRARWDRYLSGAGPYTQWARCIRGRSADYLGPEEPPVAGNVSQLFTHVLADCRQHMTGLAWDYLTDKQMRQLIEDAYRDFSRTYTEILAQREASVI